MTGKARPRGSLRLNLMAWLVLPVAAILAASVWLSYGSALREATLVTDRQPTLADRPTSLLVAVLGQVPS